jgi:glc operon protein GlcG
MTVSLNQANRVLRATIKKAEELNIKVSAAVVDVGGRLVAFQRMDGAIWASAYGSQGKAVASAAFGRPSGVMQERATQPTPAGINAASGGLMIMGQGAVPLFRNGALIGAVGVGGGTSQEDEDCAAAGAAAL